MYKIYPLVKAVASK